MNLNPEQVTGGIMAALFGIFLLAVLVLVIAAVVSILLHADVTPGGKLLWILVVLYLPILGSVAWFVVGRKDRLNQALGISRGEQRYAAPGVAPAAPGDASGEIPGSQRGYDQGEPGMGRA